MTKPQAQGVLNHLSDYLDRRLNLVFESAHKKELMNDINMVLFSMIPQNPQPQPDTDEPKKIKGVPITPKGLNPNEKT